MQKDACGRPFDIFCTDASPLVEEKVFHNAAMNWNECLFSPQNDKNGQEKLIVKCEFALDFQEPFFYTNVV